MSGSGGRLTRREWDTRDGAGILPAVGDQIGAALGVAVALAILQPVDKAERLDPIET